MGLELEAKMPHQGQRPNMHIMRIYRLSINVQRIYANQNSTKVPQKQNKIFLEFFFCFLVFFFWFFFGANIFEIENKVFPPPHRNLTLSSLGVKKKTSKRKMNIQKED